MHQWCSCHKGTDTHLLKLARFCITLAMSVSVRDVRSAGYSCIRLNREGDMMAGHMKRRNREELMRLSARSSLPRSAHLALHEANTSLSSRGNMLKGESDVIFSQIKSSSLSKAFRSSGLGDKTNCSRGRTSLMCCLTVIMLIVAMSQCLI